jgi:hypothetical protein
MNRTLCSLLIASLPFGSVLADAPKSKNARQWRHAAMFGV